MYVVKTISVIFLAAYLILNGLVDFFGFHLHWVPAFIIGLIAAVSGILILISIAEYYHYSEE